MRHTLPARRTPERGAAKCRRACACACASPLGAETPCVCIRAHAARCCCSSCRCGGVVVTGCGCCRCERSEMKGNCCCCCCLRWLGEDVGTYAASSFLPTASCSFFDAFFDAFFDSHTWPPKPPSCPLSLSLPFPSHTAPCPSEGPSSKLLRVGSLARPLLMRDSLLHGPSTLLRVGSPARPLLMRDSLLYEPGGARQVEPVALSR